ncbi:MAG TPA: YbaB/EbfC family nucleoid-associated protein [Candidatus Binatia bacterium]|nr:YbaB/EbfC family nucleoid-associated protein [Candidatus Binatia bacterium]
MKGNIGQLMRQAQQMQDNMRRLQEQLGTLEVTGESGAGMVKVTLSGKYQAHRVEIAPDALKEDKEFLEDLVAAAINDAVQKVESLVRDRMAEVTGGMPLPPGLGF